MRSYRCAYRRFVVGKRNWLGFMAKESKNCRRMTAGTEGFSSDMAPCEGRANASTVKPLREDYSPIIATSWMKNSNPGQQWG